MIVKTKIPNEGTTNNSKHGANGNNSNHKSNNTTIRLEVMLAVRAMVVNILGAVMTAMLIPTEMEAGVSLLAEKRGATAAITA